MPGKAAQPHPAWAAGPGTHPAVLSKSHGHSSITQSLPLTWERGSHFCIDKEDSEAQRGSVAQVGHMSSLKLVMGDRLA